MPDMQNQIQRDLHEIRHHASANHSAVNTPIAPARVVSDGEQTARFADSLGAAVRGVDQKEQRAARHMADVDSGRSDDLVGAMLASQEASLSFSMLMQVRNKVMGAVDELMKLPV